MWSYSSIITVLIKLSLKDYFVSTRPYLNNNKISFHSGIPCTYKMKNLQGQSFMCFPELNTKSTTENKKVEQHYPQKPLPCPV